MKDLLISVIVPVYKTPIPLLIKCVNSLIAQTLKDIEIILVDDGSPDDCGRFCDDFAKKNKNIRVIHQVNSGVSVARNNGIAVAVGEYITFVDADDYCESNMLEELYKIAKNSDSNPDIVTCSYNLDDNGSIKHCYFFKDHKELDFISDESKIRLYAQLNCPDYLGESVEYSAIGVPWAKIYRSKFLRENKLLFFPELRRMQDNVFNMYAFDKANIIRYTPQCLYYYNYEHISGMKYMKDIDVLFRRINTLRKEFYMFKNFESNTDIQVSLFLAEIRMFIGCILRKFHKTKESPDTIIACYKDLFSNVDVKKLNLSLLSFKKRMYYKLLYISILFYIKIQQIRNIFYKKEAVQ